MDWAGWVVVDGWPGWWSLLTEYSFSGRAWEWEWPGGFIFDSCCSFYLMFLIFPDFTGIVVLMVHCLMAARVGVRGCFEWGRGSWVVLCRWSDSTVLVCLLRASFNRLKRHNSLLLPNRKSEQKSVEIRFRGYELSRRRLKSSKKVKSKVFGLSTKVKGRRYFESFDRIPRAVIGLLVHLLS